MRSVQADTASRSLAHWSEAKRGEMEAFYELAHEDYRELARARDWAALLRGHATSSSRVRLLDVACGSGKFPAALVDGGLAARAGALSVEIDLLDPSSFSLDEARSALAPPFRPAAAHQVFIQNFVPTGAGYDVVWAIHALYALSPQALAEGLRRILESLRPGGIGVIAHATATSHYIAGYEAYRQSFAPEAAPFMTAEHIARVLGELGARVTVQTLRYRTGTDDDSVAEAFLQRCLFDDARSLSELCAPGPRGGELADYLARCRDGAGWTFRHQAQLLSWEA
jgi:SAM-dependent methyltransferase